MIDHRPPRILFMRLPALLAPLALLAACATEPETASTGTAARAAGPEEKIVCGTEEPTGSRLRVRRCWTQEQIDRESRDAKAVLERVQSVRPNPEQPTGRR
jgi:hypothetical protein